MLGEERKEKRTQWKDGEVKIEKSLKVVVYWLFFSNNKATEEAQSCFWSEVCIKSAGEIWF